MLIENTIHHVKKILKNAEAGHDWWHIERVWNNAKLIANDFSCNLEVVELASLLHDIADPKFHNGDEELGPQMAEEFLSHQNVPKATIDHVCGIIRNMSFKNRNDSKTHHSLELEIVQDADRLDAIGAIGIARAFTYGGYKGRAMYNPEELPQMDMTKEQYKNSTAPTINHFYEKLLLIKNLMNTSKGKEMAEQRHKFMVDYLEQFYSEAGLQHIYTQAND